MSSSYDAGYYADQAMKAKQKPCPLAEDKRHQWEQNGQWPSIWETCKHCGETIYWK